MKKVLSIMLLAWWFLAMDYYWIIRHVGPFSDENTCEKQRRWAEGVRNANQPIGKKCFRF